jgi:hypothetical protein
MKNLILALTMFVACGACSASESINIGVWTEHYHNDSPNYNEDNDFIQFKTTNDDGDFVTFGTFTNSHYTKSEFIGLGYTVPAGPIDVDSAIVIIKGYEGHIDTHYKGLIFAPVVALRYAFVQVTLLGPVVNAGVVFEF